MQALSNLIDHGMSVQQAVEAPRIWTKGNALEQEAALNSAGIHALGESGHPVVTLGNVAGGMSAIRLTDDGMMEGAACWRADGTPIGVGGGGCGEEGRAVQTGGDAGVMRQRPTFRFS